MQTRTERELEIQNNLAEGFEWDANDCAAYDESGDISVYVDLIDVTKIAVDKMGCNQQYNRRFDSVVEAFDFASSLL